MRFYDPAEGTNHCVFVQFNILRTLVLCGSKDAGVEPQEMACDMIPFQQTWSMKSVQARKNM
jgi:hypothetical protein